MPHTTSEAASSPRFDSGFTGLWTGPFTGPFTGGSPARRFDAVACDLDGCLAPESGGDLDLDGLARLAAYNDLASSARDRPHVTLCTGRPVSFVECMARAIRGRVPVMAENGVWLWDPVSNEHEMDPGITREHLDAVRSAQRWVELELVPMGVTIQPGKAASISLYHPDHELLHTELVGLVRSTCESMAWPLRVSATWFYINCDLDIVSKTTAIHRLCARTGLVRDRLAGIGDTLPDLKIRDAVAWFACPANAKDELKPACDYVAQRPTLDGVLEILEHLRHV